LSGRRDRDGTGRTTYATGTTCDTVSTGFTSIDGSSVATCAAVEPGSAVTAQRFK
jgi:hypothetical protein